MALPASITPPLSNHLVADGPGPLSDGAPSAVADLPIGPTSGDSMADLGRAMEADRNGEPAQATDRVTEPVIPAKKPEAKPADKPREDGKPKQETKPGEKNGQQPLDPKARQQEGFNHLKQKLNGYESGEVIPPAIQKKIDAILAERDTHKKGNEETIQKLETLQKQLDADKGIVLEAKTKTMAYDMESTPEFRQYVAEPFQQAEKQIRGIAERFGLDPDAAWEAANQPDEIQRAEAIFDLVSGHDKAALIDRLLTPQINKLDGVAEMLGKIEKHSEGLRNQIANKQGEHQRQMTVQQQAEFAKARKESGEFLRSVVPEVFSADDPDIKKIIDESANSQLANTPMERAIAAQAPAIATAAVLMLRKQKEQHATELAELKKALAAKEATIAEISGARGGASLTRPADGRMPGALKLDAAAELAAAMRADGYPTR